MLISTILGAAIALFAGKHAVVAVTQPIIEATADHTTCRLMYKNVDLADIEVLDPYCYKVMAGEATSP